MKRFIPFIPLLGIPLAFLLGHKFDKYTKFEFFASAAFQAIFISILIFI